MGEPQQSHIALWQTAMTDAMRIKCLNCPGRSEVARRGVIRSLCQDCTGIVLDLKRVRPGPPDKGISRPHLVFTENYIVCCGFYQQNLEQSHESPLSVVCI